MTTHVDGTRILPRSASPAALHSSSRPCTWPHACQPACGQTDLWVCFWRVPLRDGLRRIQRDTTTLAVITLTKTTSKNTDCDQTKFGPPTSKKQSGGFSLDKPEGLKSRGEDQLMLPSHAKQRPHPFLKKGGQLRNMVGPEPGTKHHFLEAKTSLPIDHITFIQQPNKTKPL